jgi:hypothetical protein
MLRKNVLYCKDMTMLCEKLRVAMHLPEEVYQSTSNLHSAKVRTAYTRLSSKWQSLYVSTHSYTYRALQCLHLCMPVLTL